MQMKLIENYLHFQVNGQKHCEYFDQMALTSLLKTTFKLKTFRSIH